MMTGGDDAGIVRRWMRLAEAVPDSPLRADLAGLARVFADAAGRKLLWTDALKGWNMRQSSVVNEWIDEGRAEGEVTGRRVGQIEMLEAQLVTRFVRRPRPAWRTCGPCRTTASKPCRSNCSRRHRSPSWGWGERHLCW